MNLTKNTALPQNTDTSSDEDACFQAGMALKTLSHFIKNILQMVGGGAEVLDQALRNGNMDCLRKSLNLMLPNVERLKRVIMDLCEYSKIRPLEISPFDLNQILQQAVRDLPPAMAEKIGLLTLQTEPTLPPARLDPDKIRQMFRHFLFHLLDSEDGLDHPVTVEIRYLSHTKEFIICFAAAIPDNPAALFEPAEYKITKFRTGLNLPLAKQIIARHHGRIDLDHRSDGQTVITVHLPQTID